MTLVVDLTQQMIGGALADSDFKSIFGIFPSEVRGIIPTIPDGLKVAVDRVGDEFIVAVAHNAEVPKLGEFVNPEVKPKGIGRSKSLGEAVMIALREYAK